VSYNDDDYYNRRWQQSLEEERQGEKAAGMIWFIVFAVLVVCMLIAN
jgi:predicted nucleic acid-binding Zn ribbon protein